MSILVYHAMRTYFYYIFLLNFWVSVTLCVFIPLGLVIKLLSGARSMFRGVFSLLREVEMGVKEQWRYWGGVGDGSVTCFAARGWKMSCHLLPGSWGSD